MSAEYVPRVFQAPTDEKMDRVCMWLLNRQTSPAYDIEEALDDASVIIFIDDAMRAGVMAVPEYVQLNGLSIENGRFVFR
jgi:hypothetical protein